MTMNIFRRKKTLNITEKDPSYKVEYLGNVQTALMKGDGCVDKPATVLWNNYIKTPNPGLDMKMTVTASGLKAYTKEQGLTEYRAHKISYCIAHPTYPRMFVWVYRHAGKKMKIELRCHAVLCKSESKAKAMAVQLHDKLDMALKEFMREKTRRQNARLRMERTNSLSKASGQDLGFISANGEYTQSNNMAHPGQPMRKKLLSAGQNYKPPIERSLSAPKLGSITEDFEEELNEQRVSAISLDDDVLIEVDEESEEPPSPTRDEAKDSLNGIVFEVGNDIEALKKEKGVQYHLNKRKDSDEDSLSSESGFSDPESQNGGSPKYHSKYGNNNDEKIINGSATILTVNGESEDMSIVISTNPNMGLEDSSPGVSPTSLSPMSSGPSTPTHTHVTPDLINGHAKLNGSVNIPNGTPVPNGTNIPNGTSIPNGTINGTTNPTLNGTIKAV